MTKKKMYKYIGLNGIITSPILLEDAKHTVVYELRAAGGKVLAKNNDRMYCVVVPEDEVSEWSEVDRV